MRSLLVGTTLYVSGGVLIFTAHRLFKTNLPLGVVVDVVGVALTAKGARLLFDQLTL